jgi:hypothetical protein
VTAGEGNVVLNERHLLAMYVQFCVSSAGQILALITFVHDTYIEQCHLLKDETIRITVLSSDT